MAWTFTYLGRNNTDLCPVTANLACTALSKASKLVFPPGRLPLTQKRLVAAVHEVLAKVGVNHSFYLSHSLGWVLPHQQLSTPREC